MKRTLSIHRRLYLGFAIALVASGALMTAIIYVGIRYLPTYELAGNTPVTSVSPPPAVPSASSTAPSPQPSKGTDVSKFSHTVAVRDKEDVWHLVLTTSVAGLLLVTTLGLAGGWIATRRLLAPLHTISQAASKAGAGDLAYRINAEGPADELKELADTFDTMLDRLEESFAAHQRFAANASHELLTPLATTRSILQLAQSDPTGRELAELAPMLAETNERNIAIVTSLLELAVTEHAEPDPDPVDLATLVDLAVADRTPRAEKCAVALEADGDLDCPVTGNSALLRQLVFNLLDNAMSHNEPGGSVRLTVLRDDLDSMVTLEVDNTGTLIDPAIVDRLFEPFYRLDSRVSSDSSGHGLGLAIVRSIVRAHHGSVSARANPDGGLTVRVELPTGAAAPDDAWRAS
ncbi:HAMP domain-containing sensor histidine kinase [Streptomyces sp. NPDC050738]|uniref:sensor histidine kinase n=1 Tax=Streptomyces sp. NPDC050738 TaxID=3154744 RepID=UPI003415F310